MSKHRYTTIDACSYLYEAVVRSLEVDYEDADVSIQSSPSRPSLVPVAPPIYLPSSGAQRWLVVLSPSPFCDHRLKISFISQTKDSQICPIPRINSTTDSETFKLCLMHMKTSFLPCTAIISPELMFIVINLCPITSLKNRNYICSP